MHCGSITKNSEASCSGLAAAAPTNSWRGCKTPQVMVSTRRAARANSSQEPLLQWTDSKRSLALVELFFSAAFLEYASDIKVGRFLPRKIDPNFFIEGRTIEQTAALKSLAGVDSLDRFFSAWQPSNPRYAALRSALANYLALADKGGWGSVPLGEALKPGMKGAPGCPPFVRG